jgi:LacI family transcriptional regulator
MQGIFDATAKSPFAVCSSDSWCISDGSDLPSVYRRGEVDGVLMLDVSRSWVTVGERLRKEPGFGDRPVVQLVEDVGQGSSVLPDNAGGARQAVDHLLNLGHRGIVVCRALDAQPMTVHSIRWKAFKETCRCRGLDPDSTVIPTYWLNWDLESSTSELLRLLTERPDTTAVIARNDWEAVQIHAALTQFGLRVPEDVSLISFDDTDTILGPDGANILTSVRLPLRDVGREGTKLLIRQILGEEQKDQNILLPTELIVRTSTAPPRGK